MFVVKAIVQSRNSSGRDAFTMFNCARVRVRPSTMNGVNGPNAPAYTPHDFEVELLTETNDVLDVLCVGSAMEHYQDVYIMNEQGKTVDSVHPYPAVRAA
jgi:hypothetical protein